MYRTNVERRARAVDSAKAQPSTWDAADRRRLSIQAEIMGARQRRESLQRCRSTQCAQRAKIAAVCTFRGQCMKASCQHARITSVSDNRDM
eukprot:6192858-Pleurochrysis_carterae.AAC.4